MAFKENSKILKMTCPFCQIDPERNHIIKDNKLVYATLSNPRLVDGHLLVIPKRHVEKISELNKAEKEEIFMMLAELEERIISKISPGCDIRQHYRPFQKDNDFKVSHLHFHLQPRQLYDELYHRSQKYEESLFRMLKDEEVKKFSNLFNE